MTAVSAAPTVEALADAPMAQARRRRTFAVISHPDAGKSTLTEALALHAEVISAAGAVHGKGGRGGGTSGRVDTGDGRGPRQGRAARGHVGLDGHGTRARDLRDLGGAPVRLPRPGRQPARHP